MGFWRYVKRSTREMVKSGFFRMSRSRRPRSVCDAVALERSDILYNFRDIAGLGQPQKQGDEGSGAIHTFLVGI